MLQNNNPWATGLCERLDCYPCSTGDTKDCFRRNIVYTNTCKQCTEVGKTMYYVGESSRSSYERGSEHWKGFVTKKQDNHILKHLEVVHPDQNEPKFEFKVQGTFKSAFTRQITEAVMIRRAGGAILNSKGVYNRCHLPRLMVEDNRKKEEGQEVTSSTVEWQERKKSVKRSDPMQPRRPSKKIKIGPGVLACATRGGGRSEAGHCFHLLFFFFFFLFSSSSSPPSTFHPLRGISRA